MHTVVLSDLHLCDTVSPTETRPMWKSYKRRENFFDDDIVRLVEHAEAEAAARGEGPVELVLNGDVFDFDDITQQPAEPKGPVSWLARRRGLGTEEWMSAFKMRCTIAEHTPLFRALGAFAGRGNRVVFVIGNHDLELHWPAVQALVLKAMALADGAAKQVRFCAWFYVSEADTFVSHGNQYDSYCSVRSPMDPLIQVHGEPRVRLPFGEHAHRCLLNGMGYFNPHATENFVMGALDYLRFFRRYMLRTQPLLLWTWFWGAIAAFVKTLGDFWRPALRDPLLVDDKVAAVAERSQVDPSVVRKLDALHAPEAGHHPIRVLRELWLDRGLLFLALLFVAYQVVTTVNWVAPVSPWWFFLVAAIGFPFFMLYSFSVHSQVFKRPLLDEHLATLLAGITGVHTVVFGHTHVPREMQVGPVTYINEGTWSPAFAEPDCVTRIGTQTFAWIRPTADGEPHPRAGALWEWPPGGEAPRPFQAA